MKQQYLKLIFYTLLLVTITIPQVFFSYYPVTLILWILTGITFGLLSKFPNIFWISFLFELGIISLLFFIMVDSGNKNYIYEILNNFNLPTFLLPVLVILFNSFNVATCTSFGYRLGKFIRNR